MYGISVLFHYVVQPCFQYLSIGWTALCESWKTWRLHIDDISWTGECGLLSVGTWSIWCCSRSYAHDVLVGRVTVGDELLVGQAYNPGQNWNTYIAKDGNQIHFPNEDFLTVHANCTMAWLPYTAGDSVGISRNLRFRIRMSICAIKWPISLQKCSQIGNTGSPCIHNTNRFCHQSTKYIVFYNLHNLLD